MPGRGADFPPTPKDGPPGGAAAVSGGGGPEDGSIVSHVGKTWTAAGRKISRPLGSFVSCRQLAEHLLDDVSDRQSRRRGPKRGGRGRGASSAAHRAPEASAADKRAGADAAAAELAEREADVAAGAPAWSLSRRQSRRCVDLSAVMCVMGNDFLPRPEAFDLDGRGMAALLGAYAEVEAEAGRAAAGRADAGGGGSSLPAGVSALAWDPLVSWSAWEGGSDDGPGSLSRAGVGVGLRWLARLLWLAGRDPEREDLSSAMDGIGGMVDAEEEDAAATAARDGVVGAGGAMGAFKMRSAGSAGSRKEGAAVEAASERVVRTCRATWQGEGGAVLGGLDDVFAEGPRGEWYLEHHSGCGPPEHVRAVARGAGGEAASGEQGLGPYPAVQGDAAAEAADGTGRTEARRLREAAADDAMALACESWVAGLAFTCAYYLTGLPSWTYRFPFTHSPMLTDAGQWAACEGGQDGGEGPRGAAGFDRPTDPVACTTLRRGMAMLAVPLGRPLCAASHCCAVITPYSLHLLPPALTSAMRRMLPWAPQSSPGAILSVRARSGGALAMPGPEADAAAHPVSDASALPAELLAAVGSESSPQAWWFPDWDDVRQDSEKAKAEWQVKLWVPMAGTEWARAAGRAWEAYAAGKPEDGAHRLPVGSTVVEVTA